ncbi:E3 ubiquitin-protein ligase [Frankliniella fusca]|uniref:E3 ubiquitin-protein ligase n=1 Tax=Frankliniella fusca TaxID=407009 RepID=A0AAE1GQG0_9NEOP|nr:E3 ubiquitin-protein ligase [Frankliniella fusca]
MSSDAPPVRWYGVMPNLKEAHALIRMADDVLHGLWLEKRDPYAARAKDLVQAVGDPARLTALLRDALVNVQYYHSRRPSSEQEGACPICLVDFNGESDEPLGRHNKRHRRRMHQRMQRLRRPHLQLDKDQIPALILRCRHLLHRHCWRTLRETVKADVIGRGLTCPLCRGPADSVVPLDLVPDEQYIHFIWVAVATLRQLTPCSRVSSGEPCTRQSSCRYCHVVNGVLVQQGPPPAPVDPTPYLAPAPPDTEEWEDRVNFNVPPSSNVYLPSFTRDGNALRPTGTRGTSQVPAVEATNGRIVYVTPEVARAEVLPDGSRRYNTQLPPRSERRRL